MTSTTSPRTGSESESGDSALCTLSSFDGDNGEFGEDELVKTPTPNSTKMDCDDKPFDEDKHDKQMRVMTWIEDVKMYYNGIWNTRMGSPNHPNFSYPRQSRINPYSTSSASSFSSTSTSTSASSIERSFERLRISDDQMLPPPPPPHDTTGLIMLPPSRLKSDAGSDTLDLNRLDPLYYHPSYYVRLVA